MSIHSAFLQTLRRLFIHNIHLRHTITICVQLVARIIPKPAIGYLQYIVRRRIRKRKVRGRNSRSAKMECRMRLVPFIVENFSLWELDTSLYLRSETVAHPCSSIV